MISDQELPAEIAEPIEGQYEEPSEEDARLIELVGFLVQGVVAHPDEVEVEEFFDDIGVVYGIRVHPEDVGRIIGKEGRVANALRQVVKAAATKLNRHVTVEVMTDDETVATLGSEDEAESAETETVEEAPGATEA